MSPQDARRIPRILCEVDHSYVYLLRCADGSLYCGWTNDLDRRLAAHSSGRGSAYVRRRLPAGYAAVWRATDRRHAQSTEALIKRLPRPAKVALVEGVPLPERLGALERLPSPS
jgi:putative endonuclease